MKTKAPSEDIKKNRIEDYQSLEDYMKTSKLFYIPSSTLLSAFHKWKNIVPYQRLQDRAVQSRFNMWAD